MKRAYLLFTSGLLSASLLLSGCARVWPQQTPTPSSEGRAMVAGAVAGKVLGAATGLASARTGAIVGLAAGTLMHRYWLRHASLEEQLAHAGVRIIFVGEDVKILIPMHRFFRAGSTSLEPAQYPLLHRLACFIRHFTKTTVKFAGFTSTEGASSEPHRIQLSKARAGALKHFMWRADLDARLAYATGYGSRYPIASNGTYWGRKQNNRIEITFRRIPDAPIS